jgi:predicted ATPase/class 3 adenylate cyclase
VATEQHDNLPTGTITFMFTDVEGSTRLLQRLGDDAYTGVLERHNELIRAALRAHHGVEVSTDGDAFFAVFTDPLKAASAAAEITRTLESEPWADGKMSARIGLHTGTAVVGGDNYVGVDVHRAARIAAAGHGGQILVSATTAGLLVDRHPDGTTLVDLDTVRLAGLSAPERIRQLSVAGLRSSFPPLHGVGTASRLPAHLTEFFGRENELEQGERILSDHRLLTLTGPGGAGKTRLSVELARRVENHFHDGAFFVSLASTHDPGMVVPAILETIGLQTAATVDPTHHLNAYLQDKVLLLVLDNLEQLPGAGPVIAGLLTAAGEVKVIATSRARLRVRGERELPVPPLPVPQTAGDDLEAFAATRLLIERATAARPGFRLDEHNRGAVAAIATRLEGLPLAIELAASRMRTLPPELIIERLDNRLLSSGDADLPERQQTIVNAIGWSYDLLDSERKLLFERCSVFSGSFDLEQVEVVCGAEGVGDVLDGLTVLVENSLLELRENEGRLRYRMLVVIREFAYAALVARGEEQDMARQHATAYLDLAERAEVEILTSRQLHWLDRLTLDHDNLRAAVDWAIGTGDATLAQRLVGALWRFWQFRGHLIDAESRMEAALALEGGDPNARARALTAQGGISYWRGDWPATLEPYARAVELLRESGTDQELAGALYNLSFPVGYLKSNDEAEEVLSEALEIYEQLGDPVGVGRVHWGLGNNASYREDWVQALDHFKTAEDYLDGGDAPFDLGWTWFMQGWVGLRLGDSDLALHPTKRSLELFVDVRDTSALLLVLESLAGVALHLGDPVRAARLHGAANGLRLETGVQIQDVDINRYQELEDIMDAEDEVIQAAYAEGLEMSLDEAIEHARNID